MKKEEDDPFGSGEEDQMKGSFSPAEEESFQTGVDRPKAEARNLVILDRSDVSLRAA